MAEGESITSHMSVEAKYGTIDPKSTPHLLAIEYPGFIKNVDKAIETLGGEESISQVRLITSPLSIGPIVRPPLVLLIVGNCSLRLEVFISSFFPTLQFIRQ